MTHGENLARLYLVKWARYRRHRSARNGNEFRRLAAAHSVNPIPSDPEPDVTRVMSIIAGDQSSPTGQEAYLTIEILGRMQGFTRWRYLARRVHATPQFWESDQPGNVSAAHAEARDFVNFLALNLT